MRKILFFTLFHPVQKPEDYDVTRVCMAQHDVAVLSNHKPFSNGRTRFLSIYLEYIRQAIYALKQRNCFDGYVFLEPQIGLLYAFLSRLTCLRTPTLILINFIPREQKKIQRLIDAFYRFSLDRIGALSVSSKGLMDLYAIRFRLKARQFFIPDPIHFHQSESCTEDIYIFSGGYSHRDWPVFLQAATSLPDLKFLVCATARDRELFEKHHLNNVAVEYNVSNNVFYNRLRRASLVVVPLRCPDVAAGHLVIVHSLFYGKAIIAARTVGSMEYIEDSANGLLYQPGDAIELAQKIRALTDSRETRERLKANAVQSSTMYTQERFAQNVLAMINDVLT